MWTEKKVHGYKNGQIREEQRICHGWHDLVRCARRSHGLRGGGPNAHRKRVRFSHHPTRKRRVRAEAHSFYHFNDAQVYLFCSKRFVIVKKLCYSSRFFKVQVVEFLPSLDGALQEAALVISHAGAGSVFESLSLGKPTLVVVNESLMDNHQVELAETLAASGHVAWTKPGELLQALNAFDPNKLVKYEKGECTLANDVEEFVFL